MRKVENISHEVNLIVKFNCDFGSTHILQQVLEHLCDNFVYHSWIVFGHSGMWFSNKKILLDHRIRLHRNQLHYFAKWQKNFRGERHTFGWQDECRCEKLLVEKQNCPYLPLDVSKFFVNLETFFFMKSNVQHLFNGDLDGLNKLVIFNVSHNPIKVLGPNFFDGHETIEIISFYDCN